MPRKPNSADLPALGGLDRSRGQLSRQLVHALREAVRKGELLPGDMLPSSRQLASSLDIARGTVVEAYEQLIVEGVLESKQGAGTRVLGSLPAMHEEFADEADTVTPFPSSVDAFARVFKEFAPLSHEPFAISVPVGRSTPSDAWRRIGNQVRNRGVAGYSDPHGVLELRQAVAAYLRRSRAVHCEPEQVVITSGIQQGLYICCQLLLDSGDQVWVENPAYRGITAILETAVRRVRVVRVPVDSEGIVVGVGTALAPQARAAFVTPSHQYPLGVPMSMARRTALLGWARANNAWIVEDDYDSELRYSGHPFPSLQGLSPERVIYLGTFSKVLFPSLRLGYAVVPPGMEAAFCGARILMDRHPPTADQYTLAAFMDEGHLDRHIRRIRSVYAERRAELVGLLERHVPKNLGWLQPSDQGMHILLWLTEHIDDRKVAFRAGQAGVSVRAASPLFSGDAERPGLILGIGDYDSCRMDVAVKKLVRLLADEA